MDFWLPDLEKATWAIAREQGNLLTYVAKVIGSYGNIVFYFTNGEKWVYVPQNDEIIKNGRRLEIMAKHYHCPVNGWDCPYYKNEPNHPCVCTMENPYEDCEDFQYMWEGIDFKDECVDDHD